MYIVAFAFYVGALTVIIHYYEPRSVMHTGYSAYFVLTAGLIWCVIVVILIVLMLLRPDNQESDSASASHNPDEGPRSANAAYVSLK